MYNKIIFYNFGIFTVYYRNIICVLIIRYTVTKNYTIVINN